MDIKAPAGVLKLPKQPRSGLIKKDMPVINYLKDVRAELKHVTWPSRTLIVLYTVVVILVSVGVAIYLGLWDYLFSALLRRII